MLQQQIYKKLIAHLKKIAEQDQEDMAKAQSVIGRIPLEIGPSINSFLKGEHIREDQIKQTALYLQDKGIIVKHPLGGYMLPQPTE